MKKEKETEVVSTCCEWSNQGYYHKMTPAVWFHSIRALLMLGRILTSKNKEMCLLHLWQTFLMNKDENSYKNLLIEVCTGRNTILLVLTGGMFKLPRLFALPQYGGIARFNSHNSKLPPVKRNKYPWHNYDRNVA